MGKHKYTVTGKRYETEMIAESKADAKRIFTLLHPEDEYLHITLDELYEQIESDYVKVILDDKTMEDFIAGKKLTWDDETVEAK